LNITCLYTHFNQKKGAYLAEIGVHELHDEVDIGKLRNWFLWREGIEQTYDLFTTKLFYSLR